VQLDQQERLDHKVQLEPLEPLELLELKVHKVHQGRMGKTDQVELLDHKDLQDRMDKMGKTEPMDRMGFKDLQDHQDHRLQMVVVSEHLQLAGQYFANKHLSDKTYNLLFVLVNNLEVIILPCREVVFVNRTQFTICLGALHILTLTMLNTLGLSNFGQVNAAVVAKSCVILMKFIIIPM